MAEEQQAATPTEETKLTYTVPEVLASTLSPEALERLKAILELQKEHDEEHTKMVAEYLAIELKYEAIFQSLYKKRSEVLAADTKAIPGFWLQVLKNSSLAELVESYDEPVLQNLVDLTYEILPNNAGYKLVFKFSPNDFFEETELVKTIEVDDMFGDEEITGSSATPITWKEGKNVTVQRKAKPAPRRGRGGRGRGGRNAGKPVMTEVKVPSFFRFFDAPTEFSEDMDDEEAMMLLEIQENDGQIAMALRESIIARAAVLYTGEETVDEEDDDDDELGEGDEDEDDDDDEIPVPRKNNRNRRQKKKAAQVEELSDSDSDDAAGGKGPALSFPAFSAGNAPAFNFSFGTGAGTTLGGPAGSGPKQFNFTPKSGGDKSA